ncbi:MAG: lytic transglycosylase domain-containing protein [Oscillospiraceae bacterium]
MFKLAVLGLLILAVSWLAPKIAKETIYPKDYENDVSTYSAEYHIDENFVFAVVKTESNFNADAQSDVGAVGLMQIMEIAFVSVRDDLMKDDRGLTYADMKTPAYNIQYGTFYLAYLHDYFGSYELAAAAYHAGITAVNGWIADGKIDPHNFKLEDIPGETTRHYVKKVMRAYHAYSNLYDE